MWYAIIGTDKADSLPERLKVRDAHLQRIKLLQAQGRLLVAGPHPAIDNEDPGPAGFSGSLIIASFESLQQAQQWAEQDPYVGAGVFENISVKPFKKVLP